MDEGQEERRCKGSSSAVLFMMVKIYTRDKTLTSLLHTGSFAAGGGVICIEPSRLIFFSSHPYDCIVFP